MSFNLKDFLRPLVDMGSETYEERVRKLILFGGLIVLALIVIWKRS
jgi:hypothetical protein